MDFHAELNKSLERFSSLEGIIFTDPDGEAILFEAPGIADFEVQLTGAKAPILMDHFKILGIGERPQFFEVQFEERYVLSVGLDQDYSITVIGRDPKEKAALRDYLSELADRFNREIV